MDERFVPYRDQRAFLSALPKITPEKLAEYIVMLCAGGETGMLLESADPKPWPARRKAVKLNHEDFPVQARLMISNLLYVDKQGFSQKALNAVKRLAAFRNPEFYKKQAMRLPVYSTPRVLDYSYEDQDFMGIPRGCIGALPDLLDAYGVPYNLEDRRQSGCQISVAFRGELRPEQVSAAEALLSHDIGVLSAATAFGKTVVSAYLIGQRKVNTLIFGSLQCASGTVENFAVEIPRRSGDFTGATQAARQEETNRTNRPNRHGEKHAGRDHRHRYHAIPF